MNVRAFMESLNLKYHAKAVGIGLGYIAIAFAILSALSVFLTVLINTFGIQVIPTIVMVGVLILFAWLFGDMHMFKNNNRIEK